MWQVASEDGRGSWCWTYCGYGTTKLGGAMFTCANPGPISAEFDESNVACQPDVLEDPNPDGDEGDE